MASGPRRKRPCLHPRRRGSVYVVVLGVAMIVSVLALGAIMVRRIERRTSEATADVAEARLYALAAIEMGRLRIKNGSDWRNTFPSGVWEANVPVGSGTYTLEGVDPNDDNLTDSDTDPLVLIGTGVKGRATQKMQVRLTAEVRALSCLSAALHAAGNVTVESTVSVAGGPLSTNSELVNQGTVNGDVEANSVSGAGTISGTTTAPAPAKEMPNSSVFDFYTDPANGTYIDIASLPLSGGSRYMELQVLSPAVNPWGTQETNPQGIYVIDCQGEKISVQNCRIVGTLVLLNPGVCELFTVNWEPAVANYPALMVQGNADFYCNSNWSLAEGPPLSFNFNPPGTPYNGVEDGDTSDSYPVLIKGLVYVSGVVNTWQSPAFDGVVVVGNTTTANTALDLIYQSTFLGDPPPGFAAPIEMIIAPGSFAQVVE